MMPADVRNSSDKEWTKEETDYLFNLVQEYDTRWYIIHDRYSYPEGIPRTLEVRHLSLLAFHLPNHFIGSERQILQRLPKTCS